MNTKVLDKILEKYSELMPYSPKDEEVLAYRQQEIETIISTINGALLPSVLDELHATKFLLEYERLKDLAAKKEKSGFSCEIKDDGSFCISDMNNKETKFTLLSPQQMVEILSPKDLSKKQRQLAELMLADKNNFIFINFALSF